MPNIAGSSIKNEVLFHIKVQSDGTLTKNIADMKAATTAAKSLTTALKQLSAQGQTGVKVGGISLTGVSVASPTQALASADIERAKLQSKETLALMRAATAEKIALAKQEQAAIAATHKINREDAKALYQQQIAHAKSKADTNIASEKASQLAAKTTAIESKRLDDERMARLQRKVTRTKAFNDNEMAQAKLAGQTQKNIDDAKIAREAELLVKKRKLEVAQRTRIAAARELDRVQDRQAAQERRALQDSERRIKDITAAMTRTGITMTVGLTFPIMRAGKSILQMGMDFEQGLANIKAVTEASSKEMQTFEGLIFEYAAKTPYSMAEIAGAIENLSKAGLTTAQIIEGGLYGALTLAAAGEIQLAEAADIAARVLVTFSAEQLSVAEAADLLVGAANKSTTSVAKLGPSLEMVAPVAAGFGVKFEDIARTLAVFAQNGLVGSDAGTSLKTMLLNLNPSTDKAVELFKQLGIMTAEGKNQFYEANGELKDMAGIADVLQKALGGLTVEQRQLYLEQMFGLDAIRSGNILYKEGAEGIERMGTAMATVSAQAVAETRWTTFTTKVALLRNQVEMLAVKIQRDFAPALTAIVSKISGFVKWLSQADANTRGWAVGIGIALAAAGPMLVIIARLVEAYRILSKTKMVEWLQTTGKQTVISTAKWVAHSAAMAFNAAVAWLVKAGLDAVFASLVVVTGGLALVVGAIVGATALMKAFGNSGKEAAADYKSIADISEVMRNVADDIDIANKDTTKSFQAAGDAVDTFVYKLAAGLGNPKMITDFTEALAGLSDQANTIITENTANAIGALRTGFRKTGDTIDTGETAILATVAAAGQKRIDENESIEQQIKDIVKQSMNEQGKITQDAMVRILQLRERQDTIVYQSMTDSKAKALALETLYGDSINDLTEGQMKEYTDIKKQALKEDLEVVAIETGKYIAQLTKAYDDDLIDYKEYVRLKNEAAQLLINKQKEVADAEGEMLRAELGFTQDALDKTQGELKKLEQRGGPAGQRLTKSEKERVDSLRNQVEYLKKNRDELAAQLGVSEQYRDSLGDQQRALNDISQATAVATERFKEFGDNSRPAVLKAYNNIQAAFENLDLETPIKDGLFKFQKALIDGSIDVATEGEALMAAITNEIDSVGLENSGMVKAFELAAGLKQGSLDTKEEVVAHLTAFIARVNETGVYNIGYTKAAEFGQGLQDGFWKYSTLPIKFSVNASGVNQKIKEALGNIYGIKSGTYTMQFGLPREAAGGFNRPGAKAIVGEAGPELLTVGYAGAAITPLTGAAKARNVEQAFGGSNVFNISVEGGWDNADRIANRVADTMNRILGSRGVNYVR